MAGGLLARVRRVAGEISAPDPASLAWLRFAETTYARMLQRDPWQNLVLAEQAAEAFAAAGDRRNQSQAESYVGLAQCELGDPFSAEVTLRGALARAHELGERLQTHCASAYLAIVLADQGNSAAVEQARSLARSVIENESANFFFSGQAHSALARASLHAGNAEEAEREARQALTLLAPTPTARQHARVTLIRALLRQRRIPEAIEVTQPGMEQACAVGGYNELAMRLATTTAYMEPGDRPRAKQVLTEAVEVLRCRAAAIIDPMRRSRYLKASMDAQEARSLYRQLHGSPLANL
jgi:tetratricopeptide (TPR) repeat protein